MCARVTTPAYGVESRLIWERHRGEVVALVSHALLPSMKKARAGHARRPEAVVSFAVVPKQRLAPCCPHAMSSLRG